MPKTHQVIIAGAGPVGLVAALALVQREVSVLVLEAEPGLTRDLRAGSFHPPTVEMLDTLGVGTPMHKAGLKVPVWQFRDRLEGVVAEFDLGLLREETHFPYRLHLEQHRLTPMLLERLQTYPEAEVQFSVAVSKFTQDSNGVTVTVETAGDRQEIRGEWLLGADGGRSSVRRETGIEFEGYTWPERFLVASTTRELGDHGFAHTAYIADPDRWAAVFKVPDEGPPGLWRIAYPTDPEIPEAEVLASDEIQRRLEELFSFGGTFPLKYRSTYRVHQRVAKQFRSGRVLLAGDAAHVNNPLGGFGLNGGIHDAVNLAEKLAEVIHLRADSEWMDRYEVQRRTVNVEYVQAQSIRNKRMIEARDPAVRKKNLAEMQQIAADPQRAKAHLLNTSMINSVRRAAAL
jgi:3-(3-hydroxy-phenyl)propionate hydroxylase